MSDRWKSLRAKQTQLYIVCSFGFGLEKVVIDSLAKDGQHLVPLIANEVLDIDVFKRIKQ